MKTRIRSLLTVLVLVPALTVSATALALTSDDVLQMSQAGVSADEIIQAIRESGSTFALTESDLQALQLAGVPNAVVAEMVMHPAPAPAPVARVASAADIARLHGEGEPADRIIASIDANPPFSLTADELALLRAAGVPEEVVAAAARRALDASSPARRPTPAGPSRRTQLQREWDGAGQRAPERRDRAPHHARWAPERRQGVTLAGALGVNLCIKDDGADCEDIGPGVGIEGSIGYRFGQWVSLAADLGFGSYSLDADNLSASSFSAMVTLRLHLALSQRVEFVPSLGLGYASWALTDDIFDEGFSWSGLAYKLGFEVSHRMSPTLDLGFALTVVAHPDNGEVCAHSGVEEVCGDIESGVDIAERMTLTLRVTHRFE